MLPTATPAARVPMKGGRNPHGANLLRSIRTVLAARTASFESLGTLLSHHRAVTRVAATALAFAVVLGVSTQEATQAGPEAPPRVPESLLPQNIGVGVPTDTAVTIPFDAVMDPASVDAALQFLPAQPLSLAWNTEHTALTVSAERRWRTDERYVLVIGGDARRSDGSELGTPLRYAFTTETAPVVTDFQVRLAGWDLTVAELEEAVETDPLLKLDADALAEPPALPPTTTADGVSAGSSITITFSGPMDPADVSGSLAISPSVPGKVSWADGQLTFRPSERLVPGARYTVSVVGGHDLGGNVLGGKANFSFIVRPGAQLTKAVPTIAAKGVEPSAIQLWFSQPMDPSATSRALKVTDGTSGSAVAGSVTWNPGATQLTFMPTEPFTEGHGFVVELGAGVVDADGNPVAGKFGFTTKAPPPPPPAAPVRSQAPTQIAPPPPAPAPAADLAQYALNQVNSARAAYGFAPLVLDPAISAVASAHAWDQAVNGYFSHTSLDGRTREDRLREGGVSFTNSGENQCYYTGISQRATLDWCHAAFMAEPYPGYWNHIANILDPDFHRMGVGIAQSGARVIITWNFTN
jgi:uncharacterized protein YkwD